MTAQMMNGSDSQGEFLRCRWLGIALGPLALFVLIGGIVVLTATEQQAVQTWNGRKYDRSHRVFVSDCMAQESNNDHLVTLSHCPFDIVTGPHKPALLFQAFYNIFQVELESMSDKAAENPLFSPLHHPHTLTYARRTEVRVYSKAGGKWSHQWVRLPDTLPPSLTPAETKECQEQLPGMRCVNEDPDHVPAAFLDKKKVEVVGNMLIGGSRKRPGRATQAFTLSCEDYPVTESGLSTCPVNRMVDDEEATEDSVQEMYFPAPSPPKETSIFFTKCDDANASDACSSSKYLYVNLDAVPDATATFDLGRVEGGKVGEYRFAVAYKNLLRGVTVSGLAMQNKTKSGAGTGEHRLTLWRNSITHARYSTFVLTEAMPEGTVRADPFNDLYRAKHYSASAMAVMWTLRIIGWVVLWVGSHLFLCLVVYMSTGESRVLNRFCNLADISTTILLLYGSMLSLCLTLMTIGFTWATARSTLVVPLGLFLVAAIGVMYYMAAAHNGGYMSHNLYEDRDFEVFIDTETAMVNDYPDNMSTTTVESVPIDEGRYPQRPPSPPLRRTVLD
eukprot:TRINITY_DN16928_c0_g1_i1.p1 TRINITY_DN16928_c0_g1~~TRINITY_DN16928_c0_g1_i1.p1  ORF type:complete len:560 (+),score=188.61 TRINITY_DN16928_c0_g1_i1:98-1777(+)